MPRRRSIPSVFAALLVAALLLSATACGNDDEPSAGGADTKGEPTSVRLGYFSNVTHASAIVGVDEGIFQKALGDVELDPKTFKDGTEAVEALFADAIDATYIGSGPAINAFQKSDGKALKIVSGATSGGASLVVSSDIATPEDLAGKTLSTPKLGNTQDVSLRAWLKEQGYETDTTGGGDVKIAPQENPLTLDAFKAGSIDGAWVPEPWATRLVQEGDGKVLVDERDLWPNGAFVTTHLIVATPFLEKYPDVVKQLIEGQVEANTFLNEKGEEARTIVNAGIKEITGKDLPPAVIDAAWENLEFTNDPISSSLQKAATDAQEATLLDSDDVAGIYALDLLNEVLAGAGGTEVKGLT
ncbi:MAG: ABC transporter substrate-binding protein [Acidimicrobiales bacterium]